MARDGSDTWKRVRDREREEEEAAEKESTGKTKILPASEVMDPSEKLQIYLSQAEPLIEQVNSLYKQYISGVELRPPLERRKHLEQLMTAIQLFPKGTPAIYFRCSTMYNRYVSYRDRWDRMMKDLEDGKIGRKPGGRGR